MRWEKGPVTPTPKQPREAAACAAAVSSQVRAAVRSVACAGQAGVVLVSAGC